MSTAIKKAISKLSVDEKLDLIDELWASIEDADIVLTPEQLAEIERRGKWAEANPDKCLSHEEFEARIRSLM